MAYGERAGSGVPDIYATWDNAGFADPIVEEQFGSGQPNRTIVTLPLVAKDPVVSNKVTTTKEFDKMKMCDYICNLDNVSQRKILANLKPIIDNIITRTKSQYSTD